MVDHFEKYKAELRQRAEARVGSFSAALAKAPQDIQRLVHELNFHQVELEMQYEELQRGQEQVEESRDRYADLYESAPLGYFTLLKDGTIVEVNHAGAALVGVAAIRPEGATIPIDGRHGRPRSLHHVLSKGAGYPGAWFVRSATWASQKRVGGRSEGPLPDRPHPGWACQSRSGKRKTPPCSGHGHH